jgi:tetratricopeptide (TPR) repeat protein
MMDEEVRPEVREVKREEEEVRQEVREVKREEEEVRQEVREVKREEEKGRKDEVTDLDFLDKSILATAVSSSIFLEVSELDEKQDSSKDVAQDALQDSLKDVAQDASQGSAEEGESNALFTWLRSVSDAEDKDEVKEELREDERGEEDVRESRESVQPTLNLIEKFIATEPRITPGKVEQYTGVSFAKESLEENFDWVTETMAKLYAAQGKIDRARKAYKRLIELHPEKKIHFENQLKVLNQRK